MAFSEKIRLAIDVVADSGPVKKLTSDLKDADGAFEKTKVAGGAAFDYVKQHAAQFAIAGATALAGFAAKAVGEFQDVALGAGQLRDSLGVTAEEASQLQEVAGDLGINVGTLESTIGKMNRTAASTPAAFDAIGASIVRNADGSVNVTETFLSVIEALNRIPDATKRAEAAQKIFGRSWQDISELVAMGADEVRAAMQSVEEGKIVNNEQIADAKKFRDSLDDLKGTVEELSVELGGTLVPMLTDAAETLQNLAPAIDAVGAGFELINDNPIGQAFATALNPAAEFVKHLDDVEDFVTRDVSGSLSADFEHNAAMSKHAAESVDDLAVSFDDVAAGAEQAREKTADINAVLDQGRALLGEAADRAAGLAVSFDDVTAGGKSAAEVIEDGADAAGDAEGAMSGLADVVERTEENARRLEDQWRWLNATIDNEAAWIDIEDQMDRVGEAAQEAWDKAESGADDATSAGRNARSEVLRLKDMVLEYGRSVLNLPARKVSEILAAIDRGSIAEARRLLDEAARNRTSTITARVVTVGGAQARVTNLGPGRTLTAMAEGGVASGGVTLVGEEGPELVNLPAGSRVHPADETARMLDSAIPPMNTGAAVGARVINVNLQVLNPDPKSVMDAIQKWERYNGKAWRA